MITMGPEPPKPSTAWRAGRGDWNFWKVMVREWGSYVGRRAGLAA